MIICAKCDYKEEKTHFSKKKKRERERTLHIAKYGRVPTFEMLC